jgi:AraC-like DNA-binding protein
MRITHVVGVLVTYAKIRRHHSTGFQEKRTLGKMRGCTLMLLTDGGAEFTAGQSRFRAGKGDWVFWNTGSVTEWRPLPGAPFSASIFCFKPLASPEAANQDLLELPLRFRLRSPGPSAKLLHRLALSFMKGGRNRAFACARLGMELLARIDSTLLKADIRPDDTMPAMDPRIHETLSHINERFKDRLLVKDLAFKVGMHPVNFTRLFTRTTGLPPHRYVLAKKIEKAKDFITLGDTPERTCIELGFHDYSHFYHAFKRLTGMAPKAYLEMFRKGS